MAMEVLTTPFHCHLETLDNFHCNLVELCQSITQFMLALQSMTPTMTPPVMLLPTPSTTNFLELTTAQTTDQCYHALPTV